VDPSLQLLESGRPSFLVERDDLAVEHDRLAAAACPRRQRGGNFRELRGLLVAEPRPQDDAAGGPGGNLGDRANAVVFRLVHEAGVRERRVRQRGQHRFQHRVGELTSL